MNVRNRRLLVAIASVVPVLVLACLPATGEKGLSFERGERNLSPFEPRPIETNRIAASETERLGWSHRGLDKVFSYASRLSTDTLIITTGGVYVGSMGQIDMQYDIHSARKAMLSAVVGQHIGAGPRQIPLDATLEKLGIDDAPNPLTPLQRQTTVLHLLRSMSGINHPAAAEGGLTADKNRRLGEKENTPGMIWAYNNWDYNALTTIFEQRTGLTIAEAFNEGIARPIGMRDFKPEAVYYIRALEFSRHSAAMFHMSGRDLARFGQLYLDKGMAGGRTVLSSSWIDNITENYAETGIGGLRAGHGFLWWLPSPTTGLPKGSFFAWGLGQQAVFVIPAWDTVVVHQSDTKAFISRWLALQHKGVDGKTALEKIVSHCYEAEELKTEFCREQRFTTRKEFDRLISLIIQARLSE